MKVRQLTLKNFRGVSQGVVNFGAGHTLLLGGNNIGKSTVCEALDLILGPERLSRRPIVDEHDFFCGKYLDHEGKAIEIHLTAVLTELSDEARNRFYRHLRAWNPTTGEFADLATPLPEGAMLALPVTFMGRYDKEEDDFVGNTFFEHPIELDDEDETELPLGAGRRMFGRELKRLCGFIYLRAHRTGARALSLQRGSLLDTILRIGGGGLTEMWEETLGQLRTFQPGIGDIPQLKDVREKLETRMSRFVKLADGQDVTSFFASDLTREHLREVVSLFIAAHPDCHLLPFQRLGTGSLNLLVFALLTFIAELKDKQSVIFAMEEPEIALPPHTQRRVTRHALTEMGQVIATSHSPYVIEQFEPDRIVVLQRGQDGVLTGEPAMASGLAPKGYRKQRKQFAEALLAQTVMVVEGGTEVAMFATAATVLEVELGADEYIHPDLGGVTFFNAGGDGTVPSYGPVFAALKKKAFAFKDAPKTPLTPGQEAAMATYAKVWQSSTKDIEALLVTETDVAVLRRFLEAVKQRSDYPSAAKQVGADMTDDEVRSLALEVLAARKGEAFGYAGILMSCCHGAAELPQTILSVLLEINDELKQATPPTDTADPANNG